MSDEPTAMKLDLGRMEDRSTESFERIFDLPTPEGGTAECRALATVDIARSGARYDIGARVEGRVHAECHRCLAAFDLPLEVAFDVVLHRGDRVQAPAGTEQEDFIMIPAGDERYDIFPRVREALILELPIKVLCRDDCRGVCPSCGKMLNEGDCGCSSAEGDPRWKDLRDIVDGGGSA